MIQERAIIQELMHSDLPTDVSNYLASKGYFNADGTPFTQSQINSFKHSARLELHKHIQQPEQKCGINRDENPCGDASDY